MKIPLKHSILLGLVVLALASIFIPMIWEKDLYPKHLIIQRHAAEVPEQIITTMPNFITVKSDNKVVAPYAWVVQLTSLSDTQKITQLVQTVRNMQYPAYTEKSSKSDGYIRVMVGPFATEEQAKQAKTILDNKLHTQSIVTQYKTQDIQEVSS